MKLVFGFLLVLVGSSSIAQQDTLYLHKGDTIIGSIYAQNKYITKIYVDTAWLFIQNTEIIQKAEPINFTSSNRVQQMPEGPEFYTIPVGEFLIIKTNRQLSSKYAKAGEIIECRLAQRIVNREGRVILPENTPVIGRVKVARNGNAFKKAQLYLELVEIHINGEAIPIRTTDNIQIIENYTAERILGTAASGSVIGGVFYNDWLEGALIGATVGAVTSLIVENKNITMPVNSTLQFMLSDRVNIRIR